MSDPYATVDELDGFLPANVAAPADALRLLTRATELIDDTVRAAFEVDDDGIPTDATVAATMRDATCAQVEYWLTVGEDHDVEGLGGTQVSIAGYSGTLAPELSPRALRILSSAGMLSISSGPALPDPPGILVDF